MKRRNRHRRVRPIAQLRMTSMMDILVVLLLFLIKSFVADEQMNPTAGVDLPESTSREQPDESVVVAIIGSSILLGEEWVADLSTVEQGGELRIEPLAAKLGEVRERKLDLARLQGREAGPGRVTIQGDREIEFSVLQKVMYTIGSEGFEEISLAVIRTT